MFKITVETAMLKTIVTLFRGAAFRAEEEFADRSALLILDQQIRDSAAGIERATFAREIAGLKAAVRKSGQRLAELERGRRIALAAESVRRLKTGTVLSG